ncbi:hypothetical protein AYO44_07000 [Planctomycetaceae bacterium SCGC AG-212-F19]|nr:hypothetical protein AYO44_07000 [Planctomycetaceae bacterium SCGC AG-212-F19]
MQNQPSLDSLRSELLRRGLPRKYVERVVQELAEHQQDILDEQQEIAAGNCSKDKTEATDRLGDPGKLADTIVSQFQSRTFVGRHPVLTFVVAPMPLAMFAWVCTIIGTVFVCACLCWAGDLIGLSPASDDYKPITEWPVFSVWCILSFYYFLMFAPFVLVSAGFCRLAYRTGRGPLWAVMACLLVALFAASVSNGCKLPDAPGTGYITTGSLLFPSGQTTLPQFSVTQQIIQFLVPLGIGLCAAWKFSWRRRMWAEAVS